MNKDTSSTLETLVEKSIFHSRWILAPFFLGLAASMLLLLVKFMEHFTHLVLISFSGSELDIIAGVLTLVDLTMTGSLLIIVIFAGYENFVSKLEFTDHADWPQWMGSIDFSALKLKLLSSIVAISAIELLKRFVSLREVGPNDERLLFWLVTLHIVFVLSSLLLALSDRLGPKHARHHSKTEQPSHE